MFFVFAAKGIRFIRKRSVGSFPLTLVLGINVLLGIFLDGIGFYCN